MALVLWLCCQSLLASEFKLSDDIQPRLQQIQLKLDPAGSTFTGTTTIFLNISKPSDTIKLYAKDLSIQSSALISDRQTEPLSLAGINTYDIASLVAEKTIDKGNYRLVIAFSGQYTDTGQGLFKRVENNQTYLFTQFQPMLARTVFPSFDQPDFKIPFEFEIQVPNGYQVLGNSNSTKHSTGKWTSFKFQPTKPLYTDVLAFSAGKFDVVDIPDMPIPSKLYVTKGKLPQSRFVQQHSANIFAQVMSFFQSNYPYDKLDFVIVPGYAGAAMENAGLMFFNEDFMLFSSPPTTAEQRFTLTLIAHEMAHMWFGNLVTMKWWNDLWLNESFAQWLANKVVMEQFPALSAELDLPQLDSLSDDDVETQFPIRRDVKGAAEVDAVGQMVYSKGNAILNMAAAHIGQDNFRQAVRNYINIYQNGTATFDDLVGQIEKVSDKPLKPILASLLNQSGFPLLSFKIDNGELRITQEPFGAKGRQKKTQIWQVPLKLKLLTDNGVIEKQVLLKDKQMTVTIPKEVRAVFPDAGAIGYYRYEVEAKQQQFINRQIHLLADNEKLAWLSNNQHLSKINKRAYADVLLLKLALLSDLSLHHKIADDIVKDLNLAFAEFIPLSLAENYSRFLSKHLAGRLNTIDWHKADNSSPYSQALKANLLVLAGAKLGDGKAVDFARRNYQSVLKGNSPLTSEMNSAILTVAASTGDESAFSAFEQAYLSAGNSNLKSDIVTAMGYFKTPKLVTRYFDFLLSGAVPAGRIGYRFQYPSFNPALRAYVADYIAANKDKILSKINQKQWFPYLFYTTCEEDIRLKVQVIFATWSAEVPGLQDKLNTIDGVIKQCIVTREANMPGLKALLN